jgi:hypothetical protein
MVKIIQPERELYMDGYLKSNLDIAIQQVHKDWDMVLVVDGKEGTGKSTLVSQMACYVDASFNLSRIVFTAPDLKAAIVGAKKYQAVVFDEGYQGLSSRGAMTEVNRMICSMLAEIRQKNLFVFIILPSFFDLDRYVALWRSRALIHVYTSKGVRGRFCFFNEKRKKQLYLFGKQTYSYAKPNANFYGSFTKQFPLDDKEYRKKKLEALNRYTQVEERDAGRQRLGKLLDFLINHRIMKRKDIANAINVTEEVIKGLIQRHRCRIEGSGNEMNKITYKMRSPINAEEDDNSID